MLHWRTIARLLVKVAGVLMVSIALIGLPTAIRIFQLNLAFVQNQDAPIATDTAILLGAMRIGPSIIFAAIGVGLIWWGNRVQIISAQTAEPADSHQATDLHALEAILIAVLGVYFLADGLFGIIGALGSEVTIALAGRLPWNSMLRPDFLVYQGANEMKLVLGVCLILRRDGIVAVYHRLRQWIQTWRRWSYRSERLG
jgi:hypothetical protein